MSSVLQVRKDKALKAKMTNITSLLVSIKDIKDPSLFSPGENIFKWYLLKCQV